MIPFAELTTKNKQIKMQLFLSVNVKSEPLLSANKKIASRFSISIAIKKIRIVHAANM